MSTNEHLQSDPPRSLPADDSVCRADPRWALDLPRHGARQPDPFRLLSYLYYMAAGATALLATSAVVIVAVGIRDVVAAAGQRNADSDLSAILILHGALAVAIGWLGAGVLFAVGRNLARRRQYWSCFLLGCYFCLVLPMLGVPTLVLLTRPGVKGTFAASRKGWPLSIFG